MSVNAELTLPLFRLLQKEFLTTENTDFTEKKYLKANMNQL